MCANTDSPVPLKLSICITTFNRAATIGATLESVLDQLTNDCEVVVLDGGSTDDTEDVVTDYASRTKQLRYIRQETNKGFDRDCDRAVEIAKGEYCWLMTDDDLLKPGAIGSVLRVLCSDVSLAIVNMEVRNLDMSELLQARFLDIESNRMYRPDEMDRLFMDVGDHLKYVGCVVIRRSIWLERERARYYGSWFVYLGVIFQKPLPATAVVIAEPLISYRAGNTHSWSTLDSEINLARWPSVVGSLALSEGARRTVVSVQPWKHPRWLLVLRGCGFYTLNEYRQFISPNLRSLREKLGPIVVAMLPGMLVNAFFLLYYSSRKGRGGRLQWMKDSRFNFQKWFAAFLVSDSHTGRRVLASSQNSGRA